jgi:hypothetical protein
MRARVYGPILARGQTEKVFTASRKTSLTGWPADTLFTAAAGWQYASRPACSRAAMINRPCRPQIFALSRNAILMRFAFAPQPHGVTSLFLYLGLTAGTMS